MNCRRIICLTLLSIALASCTPNSNGTSNNASGPASEADKKAAEEKLARMLAAKRQKQSQLDGQQQAEEEKAAAAAAEAAKPHYDPERLRMAANWRQWQDITVPDLNIHAWLKSNWINGKMHMRFALLGEKTALRLFTGSWKYFNLYFADQSGSNLHHATLAADDLHWADNMRNSGVPTMEFEGDSECDLPTYEQIVQWNLKWDNEVN